MLTLTPHKSFTKFKKQFYDAFSDLHIFDAGSFNALKIILDAIKVNYVDKYPRKTPLFYGQPVVLLLYLVHYIRYKFFFKKPPFIDLNFNAELLFFDFGKFTLLNNQYCSYCYHQILNCLNPNQYESFLFHSVENEKFKKRNLNNYYYFRYLYNYFSYRKLRKQIWNLHNKIKNKPFFSKRDKRNLKIALQNFYENVIFFNNILEHFPKVKKIIINQHYHNEALIYAARCKNIHIIELQHGLISENDIFYVFPDSVREIRNKALFPDEIWVFGSYWKNKLLKGVEYNENNIHVIGDYRLSVPNRNNNTLEEKTIFDFISGARCILVTTQTFMHDEYVQYIRFLSEYISLNNVNGKVIVKIHPYEDIREYDDIKNLNAVMVTKEVNINLLFELCNIHVSVYSTTLYDALQYPHITNFSLESETYYDYHQQIIDDGIAIPLRRNEWPENIDVSKYSLRKPDELFSELNYKLIKSRLHYGM